MSPEYDAGLDIEALYNQQTDDDLITEANQRQTKTVPTGTYRLQGVRVEVKRDDRDPQKFPRAIPGRLLGRVQFSVMDRATGDKLSTLFADLSPEVHRFTDRNGRERLDTPAALFGQAAKAFGLTNVREIFEAVERYPLDGYIREQFKTVAGDYVTPKTAEERAELLSKGATGYNDLMNVKKAE